MCANKCHKRKKCLTIAMFFIIKLCLKIYKRLWRTTLNEVLCATLFLCICFVIWTFKDYRKTNNFGQSEYPVILWWTKGFPGTLETKHCAQDIRCSIYSNGSVPHGNNVEAYLFYGSNIDFNHLPLPKKSDHIWGLYHEESPRNVEELMHEQILRMFNYSSTLSRYSDVPFPLQHLESIEHITNEEYFVTTFEKNIYLNEIAPVMYLQSDCETSTERDAYVKELMKHIEVDSYGSCLNNKKLPSKFVDDYLNHLSDDEFLKFISRYKFIIAIENGVCEDYVTEKFWRAIRVGTVPIYFGSPSVRDWLPNQKSALLLEDFPTPKLLSEHLKKLLEDDVLYEQYLEHKIYQIITNERLITDFRMRPHQMDSLKTVEEFECFICDKLHKQRKGIYDKRIVDKRHYNCPKPLSALSLAVNPQNDWVFSWELAKKRAKEIYERLTNTN
ncbi:alpha-(1,3)-fucosyltransferase 10 isoform X1 [Cydia strobilella]|uniref:alpha-(1,3)-fucosyltransferase 10 isoform X1 n=1 Tax=Cydia strobilella TaxID=1100964 RepID=UPI003004DD48